MWLPPESCPWAAKFDRPRPNLAGLGSAIGSGATRGGGRVFYFLLFFLKIIEWGRKDNQEQTLG